jgi:hypothetical protein
MSGSLEDELRLALAWEPTAAASGRMDAAVRAAIGTAPASRGWLRRPIPRLALAIIAALLLMGAASAITLLQRAADQMPGWRVAYQQAEHLDLRQTVGDYTLTLERGYADPNQLLLAFLVDGPDGSFHALPRGEVVDAQGRSYLNLGGADINAAEENASATISSYQVPPGVGTSVQLTATIDDLLPVTHEDVPAPKGPWVFHFSLPVHPVTVVSPAQSVTAAGVPITLREVRITATTTRVIVDLDLSAVRDDQWTQWQMSDATLQHEKGPALSLEWAQLPPEWTGQPKAAIQELLLRMERGDVEVRQTPAGAADPSGRWTLSIPRIGGYDGIGEVKFVEGPWVFSFEVP